MKHFVCKMGRVTVKYGLNAFFQNTMKHLLPFLPLPQSWFKKNSTIMVLSTRPSSFLPFPHSWLKQTNKQTTQLI